MACKIFLIELKPNQTIFLGPIVHDHLESATRFTNNDSDMMRMYVLVDTRQLIQGTHLNLIQLKSDELVSILENWEHIKLYIKSGSDLLFGGNKLQLQRQNSQRFNALNASASYESSDSSSSDSEPDVSPFNFYSESHQQNVRIHHTHEENDETHSCFHCTMS